ncbi:hypothetical protein N7504_003623 [Penicillium tannophilum]|nr:hypothetical protein N7504_003623 [Penicillium tannophilum]
MDACLAALRNFSIYSAVAVLTQESPHRGDRRSPARFGKGGENWRSPTVRSQSDTIRRAAKVTKIDMVEAEISLWGTDVFENGIAETCAQLEIIMVTHTPLGAGMLTGQIKSLDDMPANDYYRFPPRFSPKNSVQFCSLLRRSGRLRRGRGARRLSLRFLALKLKVVDLECQSLSPWLGQDRRNECGTISQMSSSQMRILWLLDLSWIDSLLRGDRHPPTAPKLNEN